MNNSSGFSLLKLNNFIFTIF
uniref:Uncharacterized protein n=1 Tax=Anguilla anguilla TaxID=7936 RepID=A0A0E9QCE6_ANGAN